MKLFIHAAPVMLLLAAQGCGEDLLQETATVQNGDIGKSAAILKRIGLVLPPSARVEYAEETSGMDDAARLRLIMSAADWRRFRTQIVKNSPHDLILSEDDNFLLGMKTENWNPGGTPGLKTGQVLRADATEGLNVGVAPAQAGHVRLFLFWHQN